MPEPPSATAAHPADTLHTTLREAVWPAHQRVDHHPLLAPLVQDSVTRDQYLRALQALYQFHLPLQAQLEASTRRITGGCFEPADRPGWLRQDLTWLGAAPGPAGWQGLEITGPAHWAGVTYAVEGSTLGGRLIATRIARNLGYGPGHGATFLTGFGEHTGARWRQLWTCIGALGIPPAAPEAIAGALAVFQALEEILSINLRQYETADPAP
jgi:heme oxygenase